MLLRMSVTAMSLWLASSTAKAMLPSAGATANAEPTVHRIGDLRLARSAETATAIRNGRVLVTGGMAEGGAALKSFEVFDARSNRVVGGGDMADARAGHSATLLPDGRVLVIGGYNGAYLRTAEVFDPATDRFTPTGPMHEGRSGHTATLLRDGAVLVAGGVGDGWSFLATAEVYDPRTATFAPVGSMSVPRESQTATLLQNGQVLITGGHRGRRQNIELYTTTEMYDPVRHSFQRGPMMHTPRHKHDAVGLADGRVLVLGGSDPSDHVRYTSTEIYDPYTGRITAGPSMNMGRYKFRDTSVRLADGRVLVAGCAREAELFDPVTDHFQRVAGDFGQNYAFAATTFLDDGGVLIVGGYDDGNRTTTGIWRFHE